MFLQTSWLPVVRLQSEQGINSIHCTVSTLHYFTTDDKNKRCKFSDRDSPPSLSHLQVCHSIALLWPKGQIIDLSTKGPPKQRVLLNKRRRLATISPSHLASHVCGLLERIGPHKDQTLQCRWCRMPTSKENCFCSL